MSTKQLCTREVRPHDSAQNAIATDEPTTNQVNRATHGIDGTTWHPFAGLGVATAIHTLEL